MVLARGSGRAAEVRVFFDVFPSFFSTKCEFLELFLSGRRVVFRSGADGISS